jgi:hypothetical protein
MMVHCESIYGLASEDVLNMRMIVSEGEKNARLSPVPLKWKDPEESTETEAPLSGPRWKYAH